MACITLLAQPMTMATTQLARAAQYEGVSARHYEGNVERTSLSMNWVVVTDSSGSRKLQMVWAPSAEDR